MFWIIIHLFWNIIHIDWVLSRYWDWKGQIHILKSEEKRVRDLQGFGQRQRSLEFTPVESKWDEVRLGTEWNNLMQIGHIGICVLSPSRLSPLNSKFPTVPSFSILIRPEVLFYGYKSTKWLHAPQIHWTNLSILSFSYILLFEKISLTNNLKIFN